MDADNKPGITYSTATDRDEALAAAIGRYIQASAALEQALRSAILRLLPLPDKIGLAVINDHGAAQNREVLSRLLALPDVPIDQEWREKLSAALPTVKALQEDRNRVAHNLIMPTSGGEYLAVVEKKGERYALPVRADAISDWALEANDLAGMFGAVPFADYSKVTLAKQPPSFRMKSWPERKR